MTLCGISSRFQLLSPTERQVPHALLTRSPLSQSRRADPVRLACVRHAASVRPEPGSNSQKIVSKLLSQFKSVFWINLSSKFYSRISLAVIRSKTLKQSILIVQGVIVCLTLFNLQGTDARRSELLYSNRWISICQELFYSFLKFFLSADLRAQCRSSDSSAILPLSSNFVKVYFRIFPLISAQK